MEASLGPLSRSYIYSQSHSTKIQSLAYQSELKSSVSHTELRQKPAKMSMRSIVGLNKQMPSQAYMRVLASGVRGFHAGTYLYSSPNSR